MSEIPPPEVYLQNDFDANSLKVAQLRGLLLQYGIPFANTSKKADLVNSFEQEIRPQAATLLSSASRVKPSNNGIISVAADGTETVAPTGQKRGRGRPRKTQPEPEPESSPAQEEVNDDDVEVIELDAEPPVKRPRGRPSKASKLAEAESIAPTPKPAAKRGRPSKALESTQGVIVQEEVVVEIEQTTPAVKSRRGRASMPAESPLPSVPSAPSSSRRRSVQPSSVSAASELPTDELASERTPLAKKRSEPAITFMDDLKEVEEKEEVEPRSVKKTPRRSEGSGFSDFNPFQSGSEDAADRERRRRKSSIGLSAKKPPQPRFSEPASAHYTSSSSASSPKPDVHRSTSGSDLRRVGPSREDLKSPPKDVRDRLMAERAELEEGTSAAQRYNNDITAKLNEISSLDRIDTQITIHREPAPTYESQLVKQTKRASDALGPVTSRPASTIPLGALFLLLLSFIANYKNQSASIGYCDSGATTNDIVLARQSALDNANACIARRTALDLDQPGAGKEVRCDVSALPLVPFVPRPTACAPCPQHAVCEEGYVVACEPEYILTHHPLMVISPALDGLPGVGPRAFAPSCRPDTAKKRMIGGLAKSMENDLAKGRGLVVCAGMGKEDGRKGQGERFGMEEHTLREMYASRRDPKFSREQFEEIFEMALKDLVEHDDVIESIDMDGRSWYAAARTEMTLPCAAKLHLMDLLEQWKKQLVSTATVVGAIAYARNTLKHRQQEKYKAEELVAVVLRRLQDQERLHYSDPVTTPHPFIPPTQLRDLVMPPKGSSTSRTRLWQRVQELVEANANVAVREQEVRGEMWKTWEWQGVGERHVTWQE